jgi:TM2 domain-containing membrane protein YozV
MKQYILSILCSALVVPGLGQVLNRQVKKGLLIMVVVFIFTIGGIIKLADIIMKLIPQLDPDEITGEIIAEKLHDVDFSSLWFILIVLLVIWLYSVCDAFVVGKRLENGAPRVYPCSPLHDPPSPKATARSSALREGRHHAVADDINTPPHKIEGPPAKADERNKTS